MAAFLTNEELSKKLIEEVTKNEEHYEDEEEDEIYGKKDLVMRTGKSKGSYQLLLKRRAPNSLPVDNERMACGLKFLKGQATHPNSKTTI